VAALIFEATRAAREEAQCVRLASVELRSAVHRANRLAHARTESAAAAARASAVRRRATTTASPWSSLEWLREDDEVDRALVPLD